MGVQGFPTLKIVKPGSKPGRPVVEDYTGPRTAKAIVEAVKDKIPNHVKKLQGAAFDTWIKDQSTPAKAVVFSDKPVSPLIKSLAVDFLGSIAFAQVKDKATAEKQGVTEFPSVILIPSNGDSIPYDGDISRSALVVFFSQVASPNPDPAPKTSKPPKSAKPAKKAKASSSASAEFSRASEAHKSSDFEDFVGSSGTIVLDDNFPTDSPIPIVEDQQKPVVVAEPPPPLPTLASTVDLENKCLGQKTGNCILVLLPSKQDSEVFPESATSALNGLAEIVDKANKRKANIIPIYAVPSDNEDALKLRKTLDLRSSSDLEIIALNVKRGWWRHYSAQSHDVQDLENFIDAIKLGEGSKSKLPPLFETVESEPSEPELDFDVEDTQRSGHDEL